MSTFTLVQPRLRRREWELRRGEEVRARLRLSTLRPGATAEAGERRLSIEQRGWWRPELVVRDGSTGEEVARFRRNELDLGGRTFEWKRSAFVDGSGEPLVTVKMKRGFVRSSTEVLVAVTLPEQNALDMALLAAYLILSRSAAAAAGAAAAVTATGA
jgi:hypothetical protein